MKCLFFMLITAFMAVSANLFAQGERKDKAPVTYEELYDEPSSVNKFFVGFQPVYGEMFVTNINAGFGAEAVYYLKDKADFRAHFRKTYSSQFFDFARDLSLKKSDVDNRAEIFNYYEFGGTYHIKDFEESSKTKMFLFKNSYKGGKWAARVPLHAEVPCKVRKIYGARFGGIIWDSSTDIGRALVAQGLTNEDLKPRDGGDSRLPLTIPQGPGRTDKTFDIFSNVSSTAVYVGGSMAWIKNVAVNFDKFEEGIDDLMFTTFVDIIYAPSIKIDDIVYTANENGTRVTRTYSVDALKTKSFGVRAGIDGRFNRQFSWSYGGEVGYRPSLEGRSFYVLFKISFPVFGTNLDYKVESFGK